MARTIKNVGAALGLVHAARDTTGDHRDWAFRLQAAAKALFNSKFVNVLVVRRGDSGYQHLAAATGDLGGLAEEFGAALPSIPAAQVDPFWRFPRLVGTLAEIQGSQPEANPFLREFLVGTGARDILGLVGVVDDVSISIGCPDSKRIELGAAERRLLCQVALHLEVGLRVRARAAVEVAVLHPDGRLLHAEGGLRDDARTIARVRHQVGLFEARPKRREGLVDKLDTWAALVAGRLALVERIEADGARLYAVVETPSASRFHALTPLEEASVAQTARGLSGKAVAYALGISPSRVSHAIRAAALKTGFHSATDLVRVIARLLGTARGLAVGTLTSSEREVLELLRLGWSNARIAQARQRSTRTVANQVASLLKKFGAPSRRAVMCLSEGTAGAGASSPAAD